MKNLEGKRVAIEGIVVEHLVLDAKKEWVRIRFDDGKHLMVHVSLISKVLKDKV